MTCGQENKQIDILPIVMDTVWLDWFGIEEI